MTFKRCLKNVRPASNKYNRTSLYGILRPARAECSHEDRIEPYHTVRLPHLVQYCRYGRKGRYMLRGATKLVVMPSSRFGQSALLLDPSGHPAAAAPAEKRHQSPHTDWNPHPYLIRSGRCGRRSRCLPQRVPKMVVTSSSRPYHHSNLQRSSIADKWMFIFIEVWHHQPSSAAPGKRIRRKAPGV